MTTRRVLFGPGSVPQSRRLAVPAADSFDDFDDVEVQSSDGPSAFDSFIGKTPEIRAGNLALLFSFSGRATRMQYWLIGQLPAGLFYLLAQAYELPLRMGPVGFFLVAIVFLWISLAISVKRCHDRDKSGWFVLVGLIPFIGPFWLIYELGIKGSAPSSSYG